MKHFEHVNAASFEEADKLIRESEQCAQAMAGGTDLLGIYKDNILDTYPETVINLKSIPDSDRMEISGEELVLGANCKLSKIAESEEIKQKWPALAEAAHAVASPLIRSLGTIGGNVCQDVRCWYYRYPDSVGDKLDCKRKGGKTCYAINGENRYHSVFGGMRCGGSACAKACPAGTDIPAYMAKIREGDWDGAAEIILRYNPMPMMTSRICPHSCQNDCNQNVYGESVNIHGVERSLGDYILEHAERFYCTPKQETGKKAVIIGAGPGGLAAAYYLRKAGHTVTVYDKMEKAGGVLQYGIPHYRLPKHIVDTYSKALEQMGVQFCLGTEVGKDITIEELDQNADAMYFGTGAWKQPVLGLEGENLTEFGLDFLVEVNTYLKKAIGNDVLVCGGGNVAMDVALTAVRMGAKQVQLVCLEQEHEMPASKEEVDRAKEEGVSIWNGWGLGKIVSDANGKVTGLEAKKCCSVYDEEHHFMPVYDEETCRVFEADTIILATGQRVDTEFLGEAFGAQLRTERGLIAADANSYQTKKNGVYAGGDAVTGPNVAIRAILAGRTAAAGMNRELGGLELVQKAESKSRFVSFDPRAVEKTKAANLPEISPEERTLTREDTLSFEENAAVEEAGRCMNCACYAVSPSDISPVLVLAQAKLVTTQREITAEELFTRELTVQDILAPGELIKEIRIPKLSGEAHYDKKRVRDAIDFAIVSLASDLQVKNQVMEEAKLVFGGVAPVPYRMKNVETYLCGKQITEELLEEVANLAISEALPMGKNEYKLFMICDLLKDAIRRAAKQ